MNDANQHCARIIGRKRVLTETPEEFPSKRWRCSYPQQPSVLESGTENEIKLDRLPEQLLVRIVSKAKHSDLKNLLIVSKSFRDATLVAKKLHFNYNTPPAEIRFRGPLRRLFEGGHDDGDGSLEAPTTPRRARRRKELSAVMRSLARDLLADFDWEDH